MTRLHMLSVAVVLAAGMVATACATGIGSQRESAMENIGKANKILGAMAKSGTFEPEKATAQATLIANELAAFKDLFPAGTENADSAANPEIWSDRAGFELARMTAQDAATRLAAAGDVASFNLAYPKLTAACGACHGKYRAD